MANKMKSLAKDTAIYGLSSIVGRFLNWLLVPVYTYVFIQPGEYGVVTNIYAYVALTLVILTYGMETAFFRFVNKQEESENANKVYTTSLISLLVTSVLFILFCLGFLNPISEWMGYPNNKNYILMMAITVALDAFCCLPFAYLRYKKRPIRFAAIRLAMIFANIFLNLFFLFICPKIYESNPDFISWFYNPHFGVGYVFVANLITSAGCLLFLLPDITGIKYRFDVALLKQMLRYAFPLLILGIAGVMTHTIDKILYPYLLESKEEALRQLGIYSACSKIALVMAMFTQAFRYAYEPFIFAQNKDKDSKESYSMAMKYFVILGLFIFLFVMFYIDVFKHIIGKSYFEGLNVVSMVLIAEILFGIYFNLSLWYKLTDKTYYGAIFSIAGAAVIVVLNIVFVPLYGYIASAWALLVGGLVMVVLSYILGQKYYPISYKLRTLLFYTLLTAALYTAEQLVEIDNLWLKIAYRTALLIIFILILVKRDLPLAEIPVIGKWIKKKEN